MREILYAASPSAVGELLDGGGEFQPPDRILSDLTEAQAVAVPKGSPYSIAQILAHTHFYQQATLTQLRGEDWPRPAHLEETFAPITLGGWGSLVDAFLNGIAEAKKLAEEKRDTISPSRDDTNVDYDLAESALHNAYHLGQIVLLRRIQGLWPPAGGDDNDY
jgi:hypothetical protein